MIFSLRLRLKPLSQKLGRGNDHALDSHLKWYISACKDGDEKNAKVYEKWLRNSIAEAKKFLAEKAIAN